MCYVAHKWHLEMHWKHIMTCEIWCEHIVMTNGHHHIGLKMCMQLIWIYDPILTIIQFMKEERNGTNKQIAWKSNKNKTPKQQLTIHVNHDSLQCWLCLVFSNLLCSQVLLYVLSMKIARRNAWKPYELKKPQRYCPSIIALWWDHDHLSKHWCSICDFVGFT
jgi:hypothetical protein